MFRFIHAADPHLDSPMLGLAAREGSPVAAIRGATRRAFQNLIGLALDQQVDFVVIAGDLYDGDWKDYSTGLFFRKEMVRLREAGIPVYMILGNHDAASVISRKLSLPDNVFQFSSRTPESKELAEIPCVIHGQSFPNRAVMENLANQYPVPIAGRFNLGLLHTSLAGSIEHDTYAPCTLNDLKEKGYDYWALGHIHKPEVLSQDPWIVFAGNCQGRSVKEIGPRGCSLVNVDDSLRVSGVDWHSLDVVRWHLEQVDASNVDQERDLFDRVEGIFQKVVQSSEQRLAAVRLVIGGATALHGQLHADFARFEAEVLARALELGADAVWLERIQLSTTPPLNSKELAERDNLTKLVIESIESETLDPNDFPPEIKAMLELLPSGMKTELALEWSGENADRLRMEVRALLLEQLHGMREGSP